MKDEHIKAWVTKYALTEGIQIVDATIFGSNGTAISYGSGFSGQYAHRNDWHRTPEAAKARAEEMRVKKIESLKKQIKKLEGMRFEPLSITK